MYIYLYKNLILDVPPERPIRYLSPLVQQACQEKHGSSLQSAVSAAGLAACLDAIGSVLLPVPSTRPEDLGRAEEAEPFHAKALAAMARPSDGLAETVLRPRSWAVAAPRPWHASSPWLLVATCKVECLATALSISRRQMQVERPATIHAIRAALPRGKA